VARRDGELGELSGRGTAAAPGVLGDALGGRKRQRGGGSDGTGRRLGLFHADDVEARQVQRAAGEVLRGGHYGQVGAYQMGGRGRLAVPWRTDESGKTAERGREHQRRYRAEAASRTTLQRGIHVGPTPGRRT
jgi:hypothetical protein